jgi:pyrroloquinoline quinone biosynthesis protein D
MSAAVPIDGSSVLRLRPHVRFRFDPQREAWVLLAPERLYLPDEPAVAVLQKLDGIRTVDAVVDELAVQFAAPRQEIFADVQQMLQDLLAKQVLQ